MRVNQGVLNNSLVLLGMLALLSSATPAGSQNKAYPELDQQLEPLKTQFNADAGKVRLVLLLDPT